MAGLHQRLGLAAEAVVVPWVIEPVMLCIVAHQQQAVLVALPGKVGAVGQQPVVPLFGHRLKVQGRPEHHRHPGVDVPAEFRRRLAALIHHLELPGRTLVFQRTVQRPDDAGRIAAVAGVVVRVAGVDLPRVRAIEFPILLPVGSMGQVPLDEGVRVDPMPIACSSITALMLSQPFTQRSVWSM